MFRNYQLHLRSTNSRRADRLHPYGKIIISTIQSHRCIVFTASRYKTPNLSSKSYYDLLGVERTATQKEIKKAFLKLSKQYHPDSNAADKTLHEKFVKINEAFGVLGKSSTRTNYDQSLDSPFRPSYPRQYSSPPPTPSRPQPAGSPFDWSNRTNNQRRANSNESDWGTPHYDKTFFDMLRRRMDQDRERARNASPNQWPASGMTSQYFVPFSIISFLIGFGILIHTLKGRMLQFDDTTNYARDPRSRNYHAYREWQRLSALKDADAIPLRERTRVRIEEERESDT